MHHFSLFLNDVLSDIYWYQISNIYPLRVFFGSVVTVLISFCIISCCSFQALLIFETLKWFLKFCFFAIVHWILVSTIFTIFILVSSEIFAKQWKNVGIWDRNFNYIGKKNCWFWEKNICILAVILKRENNWP